MHDSLCKCRQCRDEIVAVRAAADEFERAIETTDRNRRIAAATVVRDTLERLLTRLRVPSRNRLTEKTADDVRKRLGELVDHYGSQFKTAKMTGISQQTLSNILRGSAVGRDVAKLVADHDAAELRKR